MTTPHKWAAEIHAMADGKEVEGKYNDINDGLWYQADKEFNPITFPELEWRIAQEKQVLRYRVALLRNPSDFLLFATCEEEADALCAEAGFVGWKSDWIEVEVE